MNEQNDDAQNYALMVLAGVVALVVAGVIALAVSTATRAPAALRTAEAAPAGMPVPEMMATAEAEDRVFFDPGSDALPASASPVLARVADLARAEVGRVVLITGLHEASGDAADAERARHRALVVRHALEANGVAPEHLVMGEPEAILTGGDERDVNRVDLRLR